MKKIINKINFEKTYYFALLIFAFMLPLSRATNSLFIVLFILLLLLQGNYKKHFERVKESPLAITILFFMGFTIFSLLWTEDLGFGLNNKRLYIPWIAIFAIALNVKKEQIFSIISAFIIGMIVSELLSYGMFFELWQIRGHGKEYPSPFMMHIDYSIFLAFTAIILLNRLLSKRYSKKEKLIILFFFITITGNLFINEGRTGHLAFLVGIFATVFIHYKINLKSILASFVLIIVIFNSAYTFSDKFQTRFHAAQSDIEKIMKGQLNSSWGMRVAMYFVAADIVKENPLIGVGVGDYKIAAEKALEKNDHGFSKEVVEFIPKYHFHSQYLNILVQSGILGLLIFLMIFYQFAKLSISDPELKELSLLIIIVMMTAFIAEPLLLKQFTNVLFILFAGLFLGASLNSRSVSENNKISQQ
ncbi:MAG: O-antigen ligase family protein [Flavobacteriaceae bacterium]|nr:O-antigen ligase family protein [Flavobacteriaceae bacterium]